MRNRHRDILYATEKNFATMHFAAGEKGTYLLIYIIAFISVLRTFLVLKERILK